MHNSLSNEKKKRAERESILCQLIVLSLSDYFHSLCIIATFDAKYHSIALLYLVENNRSYFHWGTCVLGHKFEPCAKQTNSGIQKIRIEGRAHHPWVLSAIVGPKGRLLTDFSVIQFFLFKHCYFLWHSSYAGQNSAFIVLVVSHEFSITSSIILFCLGQV